MIGRTIRRYSCKVLDFWLRDNIVCIIGFDMAIFKKKRFDMADGYRFFFFQLHQLLCYGFLLPCARCHRSNTAETPRGCFKPGD